MVKRRVRVPKAETEHARGGSKKRVFRFYDDEYAEWQAAAKKASISLAAWIRYACKRLLKDEG